MADDLRFVRVQDRHLSLWQSAVAETLHSQQGGEGSPVAAAAGSDHPLISGLHDHLDAVLAGAPPEEPVEGSTDEAAIHAYLSRLGLEKAHALVDGDEERAAALDDKARKYSDHDPGFLTCATTYIKYYATYNGVFAYNDWTNQGGNNINYGVIGWQLPPDARIGIVGDWGTGLGDAQALLHDLMTQHEPAALIHLGDIYYSGTPTECQANFATILTDVFDDVLGKGERIPVFTLPGNHDYYALGWAYYEMFQALNDGDARQDASYFCLRSSDGGWQFLGMDTGYFDANPGDQVPPISLAYSGPWLNPTEVTWLQHKLDTFSGATVLLSHHQLYSANAKLNGSASPYADLPYLNPYLHKAFAPYFRTDVAAWLWGHEHNFVMYRDGLFGLAKGRLIGCSAYEEEQTSDPYKVNYPQVPYYDPQKYRVEIEAGYYNHGYAVIDMSGRSQPTDPISISYYQYPSWGSTAPPAPSSTPILTESIVRPQEAPQPQVTNACLASLLADEGVYIGPQSNYYPTLTTQAPQAHLVVMSNTPVVRHGSVILLRTTESAVGARNILGAWSTPTLYYYNYSESYKSEHWVVQKRDPTDPTVHFGDEIALVNVGYPGQFLQPYWSRVYGSIYLTCHSGDPYYWTFQPPG